jgi:outer membrane protein assembly factor BamB
MAPTNAENNEVEKRTFRSCFTTFISARFLTLMHFHPVRFASRVSISILLFSLCNLSAADEASLSQFRKKLVEAGRGTTGLWLHLGCGDGHQLVEWAKLEPEKDEALKHASGLLVQGLATNPTDVTKAREYIRSQTLNTQITVNSWDGKSQLPYSDNLVNLVICDVSVVSEPPIQEILRVLCPGSAALFGVSSTSTIAPNLEQDLTKKLKNAGIENVEILKENGLWAKIVKPWPKEMDQWTHWRHGADGNAVSQDKLSGPPGRLKWIDRPYLAPDLAIRSQSFISANGRLFIAMNDIEAGVKGFRPRLIARDAFNGLILWKRELASLHGEGIEGKAPKFEEKSRTLLAMGDRVFCVLEHNGPLVAMDAATGRTLITYQEAGSPNEVLFENDLLVLTGGKPVRAVDPTSGKIIWQSNVSGERIIAGEEKVFVVSGQELVAMELKTGKELWRTAHVGGDFSFYSNGILGFGPSGKAYALSAKDGKPLWNYEYQDNAGGRRGYRSTSDFVVNGLYWIYTASDVPGDKSNKDKEASVGGIFVGLDLVTGAVKKRVASLRIDPSCHTYARMFNYVMLGRSKFVNLNTGEGGGTSLARPACGLSGFLPANGLLYSLPSSCQCVSSLRGIIASEAVREDKLEPDSQKVRFEKGTAFGNVEFSVDSNGGKDWSTYRGDSMRSSSAAITVPSDGKILWESSLQGHASSPVVVDGKVYVASMDTHEILALESQTGKVIWRHGVEGLVDTPPTIYKGLCLFGTRTGWVYSLRAKDGELIWRFRAAPKDHWIMAYGQLESSWPVHGSVLVQNDKVFFSAGRNSEVEGGVYVYAADPLTGKILWEKRHRTFGATYQGDVTTGKIISKKPESLVGTASVPPRTEWGRNPWFSDIWRRHDILINDLMVGEKDGVHIRAWTFRESDGDSQYAKGDNLKVTETGPGLLADTAFSKHEYHMWYAQNAKGSMLAFDSKNAYSLRHKRGMGEGCTIAKAGVEKWSIDIPVRVKSMVATDDILWIAGTPDEVDPKNQWAAWDGEKGGALWALSAKSGEVVAKHTLSAPPQFDGMAASGGKIFVSSVDGKVVCFGK